MGCTALVRCVLVLRCGSAGGCGILMQAEALVRRHFGMRFLRDNINADSVR